VPQAIILAPTRELALQVSRELALLGKNKGLSIVPIYGGAPIGKQIDRSSRPASTSSSAPRAASSITSAARRSSLKNIRFFVLDECDEMLSMGFLEDIERIARTARRRSRRCCSRRRCPTRSSATPSAT
jgi:ATP-dependent RNA helicase DeaD